MLQSCQQPGRDSTGSEFMPDMAHSIAYEANYYNYYYNNTWGTEDEYYSFAQPKLPVEGTVPRSSSDRITIPSAPKVDPYYYEDTEEERTRAMTEIIDNPHPITDAGLATGKELYDLYCAICHGEKGDGNGYLVRDDGGVYPVQPANLINEEFTAASNGRFYHSIMYGKNLMGSYRDKLNADERWEVIHYIRSLQAKELKLEYNQLVNTLNDIDKPAGPEKVMIAENAPHSHPEGEQHSDDHTMGDELEGPHHDGLHDQDHSHDHEHEENDHNEQHNH